MRLDAYLKEKYTQLSRTYIQKLIESGKVTVNGKKQKASYAVSEADIINVDIPIPEEIELKPKNMELEIIYEDSDIIVINKPKGMVVHPGAGNYENTLANAILAKCKDSLSRNRWKIKTRNYT